MNGYNFKKYFLTKHFLHYLLNAASEKNKPYFQLATVFSPTHKLLNKYTSGESRDKACTPRAPGCAESPSCRAAHPKPRTLVSLATTYKSTM